MGGLGRSEFRRNVLGWSMARSGPEDETMAKGEQRGNREKKKPKKEKPKTIAANPSMKGLMQSSLPKSAKK
jgi:hypothetical protein